MKNIMILLCALVIASCGSNPRKMTLEDDVADPGINLDKITLITNVERIDTLIPATGTTAKGIIRTNPQNPPVALDLVSVHPAGNIDLADFYPRVEYVKLTHPMVQDSIRFLDNVHVNFRAEEGGSGRNSDVYSQVYLIGNHVVAGDFYYGFHCYDRSGKYKYSFEIPEDIPAYNENVIMPYYGKGSEFINSLTANGKEFVLFTMKGFRSPKFYFKIYDFDKPSARILPVYSYQGNMMFLDDHTYISHNYNALSPVNVPFMHSYTIKGETLASFDNTIIPAVRKNNTYYNSPDRGIMSFFNGHATIRQPYNDVVYRVATPSTLEAAYIFNLGDKKLDTETAAYGDKSGKIVPTGWLETEDFAFVRHTEGEDTPDNRKAGNVKFFYSYYDKAGKQFYTIPFAGSPEKMFVRSANKEVIPVPLSLSQYVEGSLYTAYSKSQLTALIHSEIFSGLPQTQQEKLNSLNADLKKGEILVMILRK